MNIFVKVALNKPWNVGDYGCSTYFVPEHFGVSSPAELLGRAVQVPYRQQQLTGYVVEASVEYTGDYKLERIRPITLLNSEILFTPQQIELANYMAMEYFASVYSCLSLFLSPKVVKQISLDFATLGAS